MAAPTWTPFKKGGTDQTQKYFNIRGLLGLSGNYTAGTGIPFTFIGILTSTGSTYTLPPTYTGSDGPGQAVPLPTSTIAPIAGYSLYYDATNASIRAFNGSTELTTAALPAALTAVGIPATFEFLRG